MRLFSLPPEVTRIVLAQCVFGGLTPGFDAIVEVLVAPVEIRVPAEIDLDDVAGPRYFSAEPCMIFEQANIIVPHGRREKHAEIAQGVIDVLRRVDMLEVNDLADPDFVEGVGLLVMIFQQVLEVDGIDKRSLAILRPVLKSNRLFDIRQRRTGAERRCVDQLQ